MHRAASEIPAYDHRRQRLARRCGIATFTTDLIESLAAAVPAVDCFVVAMNAPGGHLPYPARVRFEIAQAELRSYQRAADFLNVNMVDVACVQHEFGIFGGKAGNHVLALLRELRMPIITTAHGGAQPIPAAHRDDGRSAVSPSVSG